MKLLVFENADWDFDLCFELSSSGTLISSLDSGYVCEKVVSENVHTRLPLVDLGLRNAPPILSNNSMLPSHVAVMSNKP